MVPMIFAVNSEIPNDKKYTVGCNLIRSVDNIPQVWH